MVFFLICLEFCFNEKHDSMFGIGVTLSVLKYTPNISLHNIPCVNKFDLDDVPLLYGPMRNNRLFHIFVGEES